MFNSLEFVIFLVLLLVAHALLLAHSGAASRKHLLLLASYGFYMAWSPPFALLLLGSTLLDFWVGLGLESRTRSRAARRALVAASLAGNLGVLGFFKYGRFIGENVAWLAGGSIEHSPLLDVALPVGISFYTFPSLRRHRCAIEAAHRHLSGGRRASCGMLRAL
jgi:alginate O-acetyltransferase complex protein AlgI